MSRYECVRCGDLLHTTNPPHLCADVARRYARRSRQADEVDSVLAAYGIAIPRQAAEDVVAALARLGVEHD